MELCHKWSCYSYRYPYTYILQHKCIVVGLLEYAAYTHREPYYIDSEKGIFGDIGKCMNALVAVRNGWLGPHQVAFSWNHYFCNTGTCNF